MLYRIYFKQSFHYWNEHLSFGIINVESNRIWKITSQEPQVQNGVDLLEINYTVQ